MANNKNVREDFQERVRRIEARRQAELEARGTGEPSTVRRAGKKASSVFVMLAIICVVLIGIVATLPSVIKELPEDWAFSLPKIDWERPVREAQERPKRSTPFGVVSLIPKRKEEERDLSQVFAENQGLVFPPGFAANDQNAALDIAMVATGFDAAPGPDLPARITPLAFNTACTFRPLAAGETLHSVNLGNAFTTAPIRVVMDEWIADSLTKYLKRKLNQSRFRGKITPASGSVQMANVFVTDTSAPVYLILQTMSGNTVWNIHAAPGVQIAHVAMIAGGIPGVALPSEDISVEALRVSDFVEKHEFGRDDAARDCMIRPWRKPRENWIAARKATKGNALFENQMESYAKGHHAYDLWFQGQFGVSADSVTIGALSAANVLVGTPPASPLPYQPLSTRTLHLGQSDHVFTGDEETLTTAITTLHQSMLLAAAGGDYANLKPPVRELAPQPTTEAAVQ